MSDIQQAGIPMAKCHQCGDLFEIDPKDFKLSGDSVDSFGAGYWTCPDCLVTDDYIVESYTTDPDDYDCPACEDHSYLPDGDPCPMCNAEQASKEEVESASPR